MATQDKKNAKVDYFVFKWSNFILAPILYAFGTAIHAPDWLTWHLGPLGQLATYCMANHPYWTELIYTHIVRGHVIQCFIVAYFCWKTNLNMSSTIKWILQNLLTGTDNVLTLYRYSKQQQELKQKLAKEE